MHSNSTVQARCCVFLGPFSTLASNRVTRRSEKERNVMFLPHNLHPTRTGLKCKNALLLLSSSADWNFGLFGHVIACYQFLWSALTRQKRETCSLLILKEEFFSQSSLFIKISCIEFHTYVSGNDELLCWVASSEKMKLCDIAACSFPFTGNVCAIYLWFLKSSSIHCTVRFVNFMAVKWLIFFVDLWIVLSSFMIFDDLLFIRRYRVTLSKIIRFSAFHITVDYLWIILDHKSNDVLWILVKRNTGNYAILCHQFW